MRLLGEPNAKYDRYLIDGEEATILYSRGPCLSGWNVPGDTVMLISVTLKQRTKLSDLKIDLGKYERVRDPFVTTHVFYANKEEGVRYEVYEGRKEKGIVLQVYYEPTRKDETLFRCEKKQPTGPASLRIFERAVNQSFVRQSPLIFGSLAVGKGAQISGVLGRLHAGNTHPYSR